jgi:UPF0716 family protein affecting phage T7 exclusion
MPMMMGAAMTSRSGDNLAQGFWLLVGTQLLTAVAGLVLVARLGRTAGETSHAASLAADAP